jgi:regulator of RNase E activity RraA
MASGEGPTICAIEDVDAPECVSAWWGEVHTAVHKGLGLNGALTNGVMRDLDDHEPGFPVVAGSIGPSHMFVHVRELGTPVQIFGLTIQDGDLVHADQHGAVVIPPDVLPRLEGAIQTLLSSETIIIGPARQPGFDIDVLEAAWKVFEKART